MDEFKHDSGDSGLSLIGIDERDLILISIDEFGLKYVDKQDNPSSSSMPFILSESHNLTMKQASNSLQMTQFDIFHCLLIGCWNLLFDHKNNNGEKDVNLSVISPTLVVTSGGDPEDDEKKQQSANDNDNGDCNDVTTTEIKDDFSVFLNNVVTVIESGIDATDRSNCYKDEKEKEKENKKDSNVDHNLDDTIDNANGETGSLFIENELKTIKKHLTKILFSGKELSTGSSGTACAALRLAMLIFSSTTNKKYSIPLSLSFMCKLLTSNEINKTDFAKVDLILKKYIGPIAIKLGCFIDIYDLINTSIEYKRHSKSNPKNGINYLDGIIATKFLTYYTYTTLSMDENFVLQNIGHPLNEMKSNLIEISSRNGILQDLLINYSMLDVEGAERVAVRPDRSDNISNNNVNNEEKKDRLVEPSLETKDKAENNKGGSHSLTEQQLKEMKVLFEFARKLQNKCKKYEAEQKKLKAKLKVYKKRDDVNKDLRENWNRQLEQMENAVLLSNEIYHRERLAHESQIAEKDVEIVKLRKFLIELTQGKKKGTIKDTNSNLNDNDKK